MLDIIIIAFIFFCIANGRRKGLVRVLLELGSLLVAFFIASRLGNYVGDILDSMLNISDRIRESVNIPIIDLTDEINRIIGVIGYIVIFFITRFVLGIVIVQTSLINHLPLIGSANKLFGGLAGLVKGYLLALIAVWLISFIAVDWAENLINGSFLAPLLLNSFPSMYAKLNMWLSR